MSDILQYKGYYASVNFSVEDDVFYGKIIGINDLVSFEGTSVTELKQSFQEAVEDYLETCSQIKKVPEKTYKGSFNVRIPSELHRQAALIAIMKNMSLNDFVRFAIDNTVLKISDPDKRKKIQTLLIFLAIISPAFLAGFFMKLPPRGQDYLSF
jgi:predicted HicB family RNase H-like nuclease